MMVKAIVASAPQVVVLDPISNFVSVASPQDVKSMLVRLMDFMKSRGITAVFISLTRGGSAMEGTTEGISSLMDTWILIHEVETNGERNRALYVLKSRGMAHSNQVRECLFSDRGVDLADVYLGPGGVMLGSSRLTQQAQETAAARSEREELDRRRRERDRKHEALEARVAALRAEFEAEQEERNFAIAAAERRAEVLQSSQAEMGRHRKADIVVRGNGAPKVKPSKGGAR